VSEGKETQIRRVDMLPIVESRLKQVYLQRDGWEIQALWKQDNASDDMPPYLLINTSGSKIKKVPVEVKALKKLRKADIDRMLKYIDLMESENVVVPFFLFFIPSTCEIPNEFKYKYPLVFNNDDLELAMRMGQKPIFIRRIYPRTIAKSKKR